jgi:O-antigen ligase
MTHKQAPRIQLLESLLIAFLGASLLFKDQYSTIILILILALGLYKTFVQKQEINWKQLKPYYWIPILLILPRILGLFYGEWDNATKELIRSIPLLVLPLAFVLVSTIEGGQNIRKWFYFGALAGTIVFAIICYYPVISTMIEKEQPFSYLMRWRYMNFNFASPLDAHPAYVGLIIIWLIVHTLFTSFITSKWRIWVVMGLTILLFQLVARNALLVCFLIIGIYVVRSKIKWLQLGTIALIVGLTATVIFHPSTYLKDKFFYIFKEDIRRKENNRFMRLEASFDVFKQAPVFGPGPGSDNELRMQAYLEMGETVAYQNNYNAHNQFMEFLSTFGIFGLSLFLLAIILAMRMSIRDKNWIDFMLLIAVIVAMLTESPLERSLGVKYLGVIVAFLLLNHLKNSRENSLFDGGRS